MSEVSESLKYVKNLNRKTTEVWQRARRMANMNTLYVNQWPVKYELIDVYDEILKDCHLKGVVENRKNKVLGEEWSLVNDDGNPNPLAKRLLKKKWFNDWMNHAMDSIPYGYSAIEFETTDEKEVKRVKLLERRNIIPEKRAFHKNPYINSTSIDNVNTFSIDSYDDVMLIHNDGLGLLEGAVPNVVQKRFGLVSWAEHAEIFCLNFLWAKTDLSDSSKKNDIYQRLEEAGRNRIAVTNLDEELEVLEQSASDAFNIYDKLVARENSELSKLIGGQTLTSDQGSSYAQANVHKDTSQEQAERDQQWLADMINDELLPFLTTNYGYPFESLRFEWNLARRSPVNDRVAILKALTEAGFKVSTTQAFDLFGVEVTDSLTNLPQLPDQPPIAEEEIQ